MSYVEEIGRCIHLSMYLFDVLSRLGARRAVPRRLGDNTVAFPKKRQLDFLNM
jgi:hypothetical protein